MSFQVRHTHSEGPQKIVNFFCYIFFYLKWNILKILFLYVKNSHKLSTKSIKIVKLSLCFYVSKCLYPFVHMSLCPFMSIYPYAPTSLSSYVQMSLCSYLPMSFFSMSLCPYLLKLTLKIKKLDVMVRKSFYFFSFRKNLQNGNRPSALGVVPTKIIFDTFVGHEYTFYITPRPLLAKLLLKTTDNPIKWIICFSPVY